MQLECISIHFMYNAFMTNHTYILICNDINVLHDRKIVSPVY